MFTVGECVMVALSAGYSPYVFCGRVKENLGPYGAVLENAVLIPWAGDNCTWSGLATGEGDMRTRARYRLYADEVRFSHVSYATIWKGDLPTGDQN